VKDDGSPAGTDLTQVLKLDPVTVVDKVQKYTDQASRLHREIERAIQRRANRTACVSQIWQTWSAVPRSSTSTQRQLLCGTPDCDHLPRRLSTAVPSAVFDMDPTEVMPS